MAGQAEITELITAAALESFDVLEQKVGSALKLMTALTEQASKMDKSISGAKSLSDLSTAMNNASQAQTKMKMSQEDLLDQTKKLNDQQKAYREALAAIAKQGEGLQLVNDSVLKSYAEMKQALGSITAEQKNLATQLKQGAITQEQYLTSSAKLVREQESLKANAQQLVQLIKAETKENLALKGSYDEMANRLGKLKDMYRQLSAEERNNDEVGGALVKSIALQDAELKKLDANIGNFQRNVGNYKSGMAGLEGQMESLGGTVKDLAATYLGFVGLQSVGQFIEGSVEEFMQAERAATELKTSLENLGMGDSFERFKEKGDNIQKAFAWIDNDDVNKALGQLITYGKLTEAQIDQLLPVIVDFAAKTGKSVPEATETLIKGLEGSGKELKTFGVKVEAANTPTENLSILLRDLAPRVKDAAEKFGNDLAGGIATTKQEINDLKEEIGGSLEPVVKSFYQAISGLIGGVKTLFSGVRSGWLTIKSIFGSTQMYDEESAKYAEEAAKRDHERMLSLTSDFEKQDQKEQVKRLEQQKALMIAAMDRYRQSRSAAGKKEVEFETALTNEYVRIYQDRAKVIGFGDAGSGGGKTGGGTKAAKAEKFGLKPVDYLGQDASMDEQFRKEQDAALAERLAAAQKAFSREQLLAKEAYMSELELAGDNEQKRAEAKENSSKNMIQIEIRYQEEIIRILKAAGADTTEAEKKILDLKAALMDQDAKNHAKTEEEKTKKSKEEAEKRQKLQEEIQRKILEVSDALQNTISSAVNGRYDDEKNRIQDNIDSIEKRKAADIAAVNASTKSAQDKAAEVTLINARAQTQREQLERRQRQIDQERARFERAMAIARIVQNTAVAIAADISTPWKIALDVALGAMAMAQVLSKPIPRFATGREGGPATLAIVGDGGRAEVIESPSGQMTVTPSTPTLTFLPEDYKVHPSIDDAMHSVLESGMAVPVMTSDSAKNAAMMSKLADLYEEETNRLIEAIHSRPEHVQTLTKEGLRELRRRGKGWDEYLAKNLYS